MAHNSEAFCKAKNLFNNFFSITETKVVNTVIVFRLRRERTPPKGDKANFGQLLESNTGILEAL